MLTASCPVTGHGWEESDSIFFISLHQPSDNLYTLRRSLSQVFLLQADKFQLSQLLLVWQMFQSLNYLCDPLLDSLQYVMSLFYWEAQKWTQCSSYGLTRAQVRKNIIPSTSCWESASQLPPAHWPCSVVVHQRRSFSPAIISLRL